MNVIRTKKKINTPLPAQMFLILLILGLFLQTVLSAESECVDVFPYELDIGIYWAEVSPSGEITWQKSCIANLAPSFDPQVESIVYFHGLQPGSVSEQHRFFIDDHELDDYVRAEKMLGRNIGVFQWVQLADEPLSNFIRAEGKIQSTDYVGGTEYLYIDRASGSIKVADGPLFSVADIAHAHFRAHWPSEVEAGRVHIVGHSLGAQLVVHLAKKLIDDGFGRENLRRVTMLDPVFSDSAKPFFHDNVCGREDSAVLGCYMSLLLAADIAVELYRASFINRCIFSSENNALMVNNSAAVALKFTQWGSVQDGYCWNADLLSHVSPHSVHSLVTQLYNQHRAAIEWYVKSRLGGAAPRICVKRGTSGCDKTRAPAISGMSSDEDVLRWARGESCLFQYVDKGSKNADPSDDLFYVSPCEKFNT